MSIFLFPGLKRVDVLLGIYLFIFFASNMSISAELQNQVSLMPRTPKIPSYPCSQCHKIPHYSNQKNIKWNLIGKPHNPHLQIVYKHMEEINNCVLCHSIKNVDWLNLSDGVMVEYDQSQLLCGQCHGPRYEQWKVGVHGKQIGYWNGPKTRLLCTECHLAHDPSVPKVEALQLNFKRK